MNDCLAALAVHFVCASLASQGGYITARNRCSLDLRLEEWLNWGTGPGENLEAEELFCRVFYLALFARSSQGLSADELSTWRRGRDSISANSGTMLRDLHRSPVLSAAGVPALPGTGPDIALPGRAEPGTQPTCEMRSTSDRVAGCRMHKIRP